VAVSGGEEREGCGWEGAARSGGIVGGAGGGDGGRGVGHVQGGGGREGRGKGSGGRRNGGVGCGGRLCSAGGGRAESVGGTGGWVGMGGAEVISRQLKVTDSTEDLGYFSHAVPSSQYDPTIGP